MIVIVSIFGSLPSVEINLPISASYNPQVSSRGCTDDDGANACGHSTGRRSISRSATDTSVTFKRSSAGVASTQLYSES